MLRASALRKSLRYRLSLAGLRGAKAIPTGHRTGQFAPDVAVASNFEVRRSSDQLGGSEVSVGIRRRPPVA